MDFNEYSNKHDLIEVEPMLESELESHTIALAEKLGCTPYEVKIKALSSFFCQTQINMLNGNALRFNDRGLKVIYVVTQSLYDKLESTGYLPIAIADSIAKVTLYINPNETYLSR